MTIVPLIDYDEGGTGPEWFLSRLREAQRKLIEFTLGLTKSRVVIITL